MKKLFSIFFALALLLPLTITANTSENAAVTTADEFNLELLHRFDDEVSNIRKAGGSSSYKCTVNYVIVGSGSVDISYKNTSNQSAYVNGATSSGSFVARSGSQNSSTATFSAAAGSGYTFTSMTTSKSTISVSGTTGTLTIPKKTNDTYTVTITFTATAKYDVSTAVTPTGYGTVSTSPATTTQLSSGTSVTLTANPSNSAYYFDYWTNSAGTTVSTSSSYTFSVNATDTYTAHFGICSAGVITGAASPAAGGTVTVDQSSTAGGTAVTLTATSNSGYQFVKWNDGSTDATRTVYVNGTKTYTATFTQGKDYQSATWCKVIRSMSTNYYNISLYDANDDIVVRLVQVALGAQNCIHGNWWVVDNISSGLYLNYLYQSNSQIGGSSSSRSMDGDISFRYTGTSNSTGPIYNIAFSLTYNGNTYEYEGELPVVAQYTPDGSNVYNLTLQNNVTEIICETGMIAGSNAYFDIMGLVPDKYKVEFDVDAKLSAGVALYTYNASSTSYNWIQFLEQSETKLGMTTTNTGSQIVVNYDNEINAAKVRSVIQYGSTYYYVEIYQNQISSSTNTQASQYWLSSDATSSFSYNFGSGDVDVINTRQRTIWAGNSKSYCTFLEFIIDPTKQGNIPTGTYKINFTNFEQTVNIGGTNGTYFYGSYSADGYSNWYIRGGTAEVINVNEVYYISVDAYNSRNQDVTETIGTAPHNITFNSDANGSVSASFNATNWSKTITDYEEGTAYPFFNGQQIVLTPTPKNGNYEFDSWTVSGATVVDNEDGTYTVTMGSSNVTMTANFKAASTPVDVTLDPNDGTTGNEQTVSATNGSPMPSTRKSDGGSIEKPEFAGYDFGGYVLNADGTGKQYYTTNLASASNWDQTEATTIYAKWTQVVTLDKNGGSANGTVTVTYNANTTASFSAVTGLPEGYSALKGYYDAAADGNKIFNADGTLVSYSSAVSSYLSSDGKWNHNGVAPTIYAQFTPNTNTNYTVKHWQQNIADDNYTEVEADRQTLQGTTATPTAATAKIYPGFEAQTITQGTIAGDGSTVVNIYYNRDTYTVNLAVSPAGYGSVSPSAAITGVRYGTVITTGTGENANKVTINKTVVTANPAATTAEYTYTFDNWINGTATVTGSGLTVTANFTRTTNPYDIVWKSEDGTSTLETDNAQAYGTPTAYNGATTPTKTVTGYTYTFDGWTTKPNGAGTFYANGETPTVSGAATYYAHFTGALVPYTINYEGLNGATNTNPTSYNVETPTITLQDPGTRDGYIFAGWKDESDNTITQIAKGSTGNRTLTATWNVKSSNIELCENCNDAHYNTFKTNYNGETVNVTYKRQFAEGRWSTMCLPFSLDLAAMITHQMYGCVYEFKYATGNANVGSGVNLYFSNAKSIEAGKCYIVNANSALETQSKKTPFVFAGVTIDLSKDNGAALDSEDAYDDLPGDNSQGTIELVGTLRNGTLKGSDTGNNRYMGLKSNKIYYPNTGTGSTIWAYRGIFRSSEFLDKESMQKMRIIVDGEDRGEIIIDADGDILAPSDAASRKFIRDGVLYIEREGVVYDAQGKRVEGM